MASDGDVVRLRCSPANQQALRKGINVSFVKLALGVDGIFELYIEGGRLPDHGDHPLVPVEDS